LTNPDSAQPAEGTKRQQRIRQLVDDCFRRWSAGESIADAEVVRAHPDLEPELGEELRKARLVAGAMGMEPAASSAPAEPELTAILVGHNKPRSSRGLHIRCPHCRHPIEMLVDAPLSDVTCNSCGSNFSLLGNDPQSGQTTPLRTMGHFELLERLGIGGFGSVWKAHDMELDRIVAIKIPRRSQLDPTEEEQFLREARVAAQLRHPNIVAVHEIGREGDTIYIVSDIIPGVPLSDWLVDNQPTFTETAALCGTVAEALHHAHQAGVVHRDLKPSNIMIDESGQPHIMDFGLAKREVGEITMTADGAILGTAAYMSPEQAEGRSHFTDRRSDIYSMGVILFQMLTGELPFRGSPQMLIQQVANDEPPVPRKLNRHIPFDLQTICLKCLEKKRESRFSSANTLAAELDRYLNHEPIRSRPISRIERSLRWCGRNPWQAAVAGLVVLIAVVGPPAAAYQYWQRTQILEKTQELYDTDGQMREERTASNRQLDDLTKRTQTLEGRLAPDNPLKQAELLSSKTMLLDQIYVRHYKSALDSPDEGAKDFRSRAFKNLSGALIARQLGRRDQALRHWEAARDALLELKTIVDAPLKLESQLADCYFQIGQIHHEMGDKESAMVNVKNALGIYNHLKKTGSLSAQTNIDMAEVFLLMAPLEEDPANFLSAKALLDDVIENWPEDSAISYDLLRQLVRPGARKNPDYYVDDK